MKGICICIEVSTVIGQPKSMCGTLCQNQLINVSSKRRFAVMILLSHKQTTPRIAWQDLWLTLRFFAEYKTRICNTCLICLFEWRGANLLRDEAGERCFLRWRLQQEMDVDGEARVRGPFSPSDAEGNHDYSRSDSLRKTPSSCLSACFKNTLHYLQPLSVLIAGMLLQTIFLSSGSAMIISVRLRRVKAGDMFF